MLQWKVERDLRGVLTLRKCFSAMLCDHQQQCFALVANYGFTNLADQRKSYQRYLSNPFLLWNLGCRLAVNLHSILEDTLNEKAIEANFSFSTFKYYYHSSAGGHNTNPTFCCHCTSLILHKLTPRFACTISLDNTVDPR